MPPTGGAKAAAGFADATVKSALPRYSGSSSKNTWKSPYIDAQGGRRAVSALRVHFS
jgi:hypothetical protein